MKQYKWMTRTECNNFVRELLIAGVMLGCFAIAVQFQTPGLIWLGRVPFALIFALGIKQFLKERDWIMVFFGTPALIVTLIGAGFSAMMAFLWFVLCPVVLIGYAFLTPLNYLLKNFILWRDL